jgi:hypothetical protein
VFPVDTSVYLFLVPIGRKGKHVEIVRARNIMCRWEKVDVFPRWFSDQLFEQMENDARRRASLAVKLLRLYYYSDLRLLAGLINAALIA